MGLVSILGIWSPGLLQRKPARTVGCVCRHDAKTTHRQVIFLVSLRVAPCFGCALYDGNQKGMVEKGWLLGSQDIGQKIAATKKWTDSISLSLSRDDAQLSCD